jgi:hypothetical protein
VDKWTKAIRCACKNVDKYLTTLWKTCVKTPASPEAVEKLNLVIGYSIIIHKNELDLSTFLLNRC